MALSPDDSLATLAESDAYSEARGWEDWAAAADPVREAKLREATDFIRTLWRWPTYIADADGVFVDAVPAKVKAATIEAARLALTGPLLGGAPSAVVKSEREKIGALETETDYATTTPSDDRRERLAWVTALLRASGAKGGGGSVNVRLQKA